MTASPSNEQLPCEYRQESRCLVAESILRAVGVESECPLPPDACQNCLARPNARDVNSMTIGVAVLAVGPSSEAAGAVVRMFGDKIDRATAVATATIDDESDYGAGTELTRFLSWLGYEYTPDCNCRGYAATMNRNGIEWCEQNISTIVGWLKYEANARGILFSKIAAVAIVRLAIAKAKVKMQRKAACNGLSQLRPQGDGTDGQVGRNSAAGDP